MDPVVGGKPTLQAESLTAPELFEWPQLAVRRANKFLREQLVSNFRVRDHSFPAASQPVIGLETAGGALLRHAGKRSPMGEPATGQAHEVSAVNFSLLQLKVSGILPHAAPFHS
jgi:hypothetical protein